MIGWLLQFLFLISCSALKKGSCTRTDNQVDNGLFGIVKKRNKIFPELPSNTIYNHSLLNKDSVNKFINSENHVCKNCKVNNQPQKNNNEENTEKQFRADSQYYNLSAPLNRTKRFTFKNSKLSLLTKSESKHANLPIDQEYSYEDSPFDDIIDAPKTNLCTTGKPSTLELTTAKECTEMNCANALGQFTHLPLPTGNLKSKCGLRQMLQCHPSDGIPKSPINLSEPTQDTNYQKALTGELAELIIDDIYKSINKDQEVKNEIGICAQDLAYMRDSLTMSPQDNKVCCPMISGSLKCFLKWILYQEPLKKKRSVHFSYYQPRGFKEHGIPQRPILESYVDRLTRFPRFSGHSWHARKYRLSPKFKKLIENKAGCL